MSLVRLSPHRKRYGCSQAMVRNLYSRKNQSGYASNDIAAYSISTLAQTTFNQGRKKVRWRPGQVASVAPPYSNLRSFRSKCTVLKEVLVTSLGHFGAPHSHSVPPE